LSALFAIPPEHEHGPPTPPTPHPTPPRQLTQKKTALQFKTLDSVLQTYNKDTGAKQAITYRCADMDRMVPSIMGVSKVRAAGWLGRAAGCCLLAVGVGLGGGQAPRTFQPPPPLNNPPPSPGPAGHP